MKTKLLVITILIFNSILFAILALGVFVLGASTVRAQDNTVSEPVVSDVDDRVYLFDELNNQLMRVNVQDGSQQFIELGIEETSMNVNRAVVSHDGRLMAYCGFEPQPAEQVISRLIVYDLVSDQNVFQYEFDNLCYVGTFSMDDNYIAIGLANQANMTSASWSVQIYDAHTGAIARNLHPDSLEPDTPIMPDVIYLDDENLYFKGLPMVEPQFYVAYHWDLSTDALTLVENLGHPGSTFLPSTGEIAFPVGVTLEEAHELQIQSANETHVIYRNPDYHVNQAFFIGGGDQLAVHLINAGNIVAETTPLTSQYIVLDRSGNLINSDLDRIYDLVSTAEGLVALRITNTPQGSVQQLISYVDDVTQVLWEASISVPARWTIASSPVYGVNSDLNPFVAID